MRPLTTIALTGAAIVGGHATVSVLQPTIPVDHPPYDVADDRAVPAKPPGLLRGWPPGAGHRTEEEPGSIAPQRIDDTGQYVEINVPLGVNVRTGPSRSQHILVAYPEGTKLKVAGRQGGWLHVANPATGTEGWVLQEYTSSIGKNVRHPRSTVDMPPLSMVRMGADFLNRGNNLEAIRLFTAALNVPSLNRQQRVQAFSLRGVASWREGQLAAALQDLNEALEIEDSYPHAHNNRGNILLSLGEPEEAIHAFDRAIDLWPEFGNAYHNRGNAHIRLGRHEAAVDDFDHAIRLLGENAVPLNGRGTAHLALGRPYAALRDFSAAVQINAEYATALAGKANALAATGRHEEAVRQYANALELTNGAYELRLAMVRSLIELKRLEAALDELDSAVELAPDTPQGHLLKAEALLLLEHYDEAEAALGHALKLDPDSAPAHALMARSALRQSDLPRAITELSRAALEEPHNSYVLKVQAEFLLAEGEGERAQHLYAQALATEPNNLKLREAIRDLMPEDGQMVEGASVGGWRVRREADGLYFAAHPQFGDLRVPLEMHSPDTPSLMSWKHPQGERPGVLTYSSQSDGDRPVEHAAIIDTERQQVLAIEPYRNGEAKAIWDWDTRFVTLIGPDDVRRDLQLAQQQSATSQARPPGNAKLHHDQSQAARSPTLTPERDATRQDETPPPERQASPARSSMPDWAERAFDHDR